LLGAEGFMYSHGSLTPITECIMGYSGGNPVTSIILHRKVIDTDISWRKVDFIDFTILPEA